jgi:hypothetical protein
MLKTSVRAGRQTQILRYHVHPCHRVAERSLSMLPYRVLVVCWLFIAALTANPVWSQPAKPKEGALGMKFVALPKATFYVIV